LLQRRSKSLDSRFRGNDSKDGEDYFFINRLMINDKGLWPFVLEGQHAETDN